MNKPWTKEETIIAFNVYRKIPFGKSNKANPVIVKYAKLLGRTPSALNMKIGNIGRLDPDLRGKGISGLTHGAKMEQEVWADFYGNPERLAFESERLIAEISGQSIEESSAIDMGNLPQGKERGIIVRQRVNQSFFRASVMSAYDFRCCISGVSNPELLEACHIVDWSMDETNRTNPRNGLCLNPFFHKAYDKLLIAITPDYTLKISDEIISNTMERHCKDYLKSMNGSKIHLPNKFLPQQDLLASRYDLYKQKQGSR